MDNKHIFLLCALALATTCAYAANPVSQEWVLQQLALHPQLVTAADWNAICTSGSVTSSTGCYGNVTSQAFTKINNDIGGFTRYANINPVNSPASVFVKAFFGGTNTPISNNVIDVHVINSAARCVLFTEVGFGAGPSGINNSSPANGNTSGSYVPPQTISVLAINNGIGTISYKSDFSIGVGGSPNQDPLYLLCVGYSTTDGTTASAINVSAT